MARKKIVVFGLLGTTLDEGRGPKRWERWRPTVALCQHPDLLIDRLELIHGREHRALAELVREDIGRVSPETKVVTHVREIEDPWDLEEVYGVLHDFARGIEFRVEDEDYLVHITTGTHIAQICLFLLTESRDFPARLLQGAPAPPPDRSGPGRYAIIDLDLSSYDQIASRFQRVKKESLSFLKSGIETKNARFNRLIERIEQVAIASKDPILLMGPTGSGKSQLARRIFELKRARRQVEGAFVEVNCATIRGDGAMSALFGHVKGAFTGAVTERAGMLRKASEGVLFLDEIGELGADEQAMLLRAIEEKSFYPVGSDREATSSFQLIAGTNRSLAEDVETGRFREDLLARINLWTFRLPGLRERAEDIEPNLDYELEQCGLALKVRLTISREARRRFLDFATSPAASWRGNFRDFNASVRRMATLSKGGRIGLDEVDEEIERLREAWRTGRAEDPTQSRASAARASWVTRFLGPEAAAKLDRFDRAQLEEVLGVCRESASLSEAGRRLFEVSRTRKTSTNDADRLRKYLARFDLEWSVLKEREARDRVD